MCLPEPHPCQYGPYEPTGTLKDVNTRRLYPQTVLTPPPQQCDRLVRPIQEHIWRSTRVGAVGWPVFEHREAFFTLLSGATIAHSLIRTGHLAPCHDIRYSRCLPEPSGASNRENASGGLHVWERSVGRCLSIVKLS